LRDRYGARPYDIETEVLITVGVSEAMYLAMQAILDPGDEVIVPQPCFVSYTASVILAGGNVVDVPTYAKDNFFVNPEAIEAAITPNTKALLIGFPSNPTGAVMDMGGMLEIARIAEKHDLIVISDEIYDRLVYGDHEHIMFAALPGMAERTIHLGGMSKDYAMTGWRIGYALGPEDLLGAMRKIHQYLIMSAPTTGQEAALAAFTDPTSEEYVQQMVASYDMRRRLIVDGLNSIGLDCFEPKGAFYAFPSIRITGMNEHEFCERLLVEEHVAVIPGSAFGCGGEGHVRCAYAASVDHIEKALERMDRFIRRHA
jgi:aminotransferase